MKKTEKSAIKSTKTAHRTVKNGFSEQNVDENALPAKEVSIKSHLFYPFLARVFDILCRLKDMFFTSLLEVILSL